MEFRIEISGHADEENFEGIKSKAAALASDIQEAAIDNSVSATLTRQEDQTNAVNLLREATPKEGKKSGGSGR